MPGPALTEFVVVNITLTAGAVVEAFGFGSLLGVFNHSATANRSDGPYSDITELEADGFTAAAEAEVHAWASSAFAQDPKITELWVGREDALDTDLTDTLNQVEADVGGENFYLLNTESRLEADILLGAAWAESRPDDKPKIYIAQTADQAVLDGTAGNVLEDLNAAAYDRTAGIYHRHSVSSDGAVATDGYLDAAWSSRAGAFRLDDQGGRGTWGFKNLSGVTADPVTPTEAATIYGNEGNVYGTTKGVTFTSKGTAASGQFIDTTTTLDWTRLRLSEATLQEFVDEPNVIPYTAAGLNRIRTVAQKVLERGVRNGHYSPDFDRIVTPPRIEEVSDADKLARVVTYTAEATLAGGIQKVTYNVVVHP